VIKPAPKKSGGLFDVIDLRSYLTDGVFREAEFRASLRREDWSRFSGRRVLVKGCGKPPVPPWAYMLVLSQLSDSALMVAYGEECAPIVVHRHREAVVENWES